MIYINITNFVLISKHEKDHSMVETRRLKNAFFSPNNFKFCASKKNYKYQTHVACSFGYVLVCVDDKFSRPLKSYLHEHDVYNFVSGMIQESKHFSDVMKNILTKNL